MTSRKGRAADSQKIIKNLENNDMSTLLDDIQTLLKNGKCINCSEACSLLKAFYQVMKSSESLKDKEGHIFDLIPSINLCLDYAQSNFGFLELEKHQYSSVLYYIITIFLKAELYFPSLSCAEKMKSFLSDPEYQSDDKLIYAKNMSVLFWNEALQIEKNEKLKISDTSFDLRCSAIYFLLLDKSSSRSINDKVTVALIRYCNDNNEIDTKKILFFLGNVWSEIKCLESSFSYKVYLFKVIYSWIEAVLKYLNNPSILQDFLPWFKDIADCCSENRLMLRDLVEISKITIQILSLREQIIISKTDLSRYQKCSEGFLDCTSEEASLFAQNCMFIYSNFVKNLRCLKYLKFERGQLEKFL